MNYTLNTSRDGKKKGSLRAAFKRLSPLLAAEKKKLAISFAAILLTSVSSLLAPVLISHTLDTSVALKNYNGILVNAAILLGIFLVGLVSSYAQTKTMGGVGRRVLFHLRNNVFTKLQELPVAFFNANKAGDLISRINNDTDKLNQFFSQALMQFIGSFFVIVGAGLFLISLNIRLGLMALLPAFAVIVISQLIGGWVKRKNTYSLQTLGGMSSEIQESLNNFRVIVAFNRKDYFREKFNEANQNNFTASVGAGVANNVFVPLYGLAANLAQLTVVAYGIYLIMAGNLTLGLLIGFLMYVNSFYTPMRQLATVWSSFQLALAAFDRVSEVLSLESNMPIIAAQPTTSKAVLEFQHVSFQYSEDKEVLRDANFELLQGKTYALVGPTGGGKTTTASLMARLFDATQGTILLDGRDIRSYQPAERTKKIGFILQEPFLFTGTVRDNILYGNEEYLPLSNEELIKTLEKANLSRLLDRFTQGLDTPVTTSGNSISLGQKQLIAFMRAALRRPELLILDEATANIDTVTEQLLEEILQKIPKTTTRVIIAHRLNTIQNADQIFFINSGEIIPAGSMEHAMDMLLHGKRES